MDFTLSNVKGLYFISPDTFFSTIEKKIKEFGRNYVLQGFVPINLAIDQYQQSTDKHLFGVFCVSEEEQQDQWICFNVVKKDGVRGVPVAMDTFKQEGASTYKFVEKTLTLIFIEKSYNINISQYYGSLSNACKNVLETINTLHQSFDQAVVEGIGQVQYKSQLQRFLPSLESLLTTHKDTFDQDEGHLDETSTYTLDSKLFRCLCEKINSENFGPSNEDVRDLRVKILALIVQMKENGQIIDNDIFKDVFEIEGGFIVKDNSLFLNQIEKYDKELQTDPRNVTTAASFKFVINEGIDYLSNKNKLVPDLVSLDAVSQIFEHFVLDEKVESLKIEENRLKQSCVEQFNYLSNKNNSVEENRQQQGSVEKSNEATLIQASIDDNTRLEQMHRELEYLRVKLSIRNECNFKDLIPVFASKALDNLTEPHKFLSKIFKINISESLIPDIIKIVSKTDNIQSIPDNFYQYLTPEQLIESTERLSMFSNTLIERLVTILIENDQHVVRERALDALKKHSQEFSDEIEAIVNLESKIQTDYFNTTDILTHVTKNYRLTWNSFQTFTHIGDEELTIIKTIIDNDLQTLPKFLVDAIKKEIKSNLVQSKLWFIQKVKDQFLNSNVILLMLKMCELMIGGEYMSMCEVSDFLGNYLKNKKYRDTVLNIILTAARSGEIMSEPIVKELLMIEPKTALVHNCIRAVTKKDTPFDVLNNSKKSIEDRKSALNQLINDTSYHTHYLFQILMGLVISEQRLRDDAFEAILTIITQETWQNCSDRFAEMVEALKVPDSKVSIEAISDASKKDFLQHNDALIGYLLFRLTGDDLGIKTDCVSILTNMLNSSQNENWLQSLLDIAYSEHDIEIKKSILTLIVQGFTLESLNLSVQAKVETLKILLCDNIDETLLSSLVNPINNGFVVSDSVVQEIIRCLPNEGYATVASECLWVIHTKQGLLPQFIHQVLSTINDHPNILNIKHLLKLLHQLESDQKLSVRVIEKLLKLLGDNDLNLLAINFLNDYMIRFQHDTELINLKQEFIQILQKHCLEMLNIELVRHALKTLLKIDVTISTNNEFIRDFYEQLQPLILFSNDDSKTTLDKFMSTTSNKDRIQLLHALTITVMNNYHLNPRTFVQTPESEWLKDLLIDSLVHSIIIETREWDEPALVDFLNEIKVLEIKLSQNDQRLEPVLECLVDSNLNSFANLTEVLYLIRDEDALEVFLSNSKNFNHKMYKMKSIFLKKRLPSFSSQQIEELMKCISHHPTDTIEKLIDIDYETPEQLLTFFTRVQTTLDKQRQETFLNKILSIKSLEIWNLEVSKEIIKCLIEKKQIVLNDAMISIEQRLYRVLDGGWSTRSIEMILDRCKGLKDGKSILSALDVIYEYKLKEYDTDVSGTTLIDHITTTPVTEWGKIFHKIAIFQTFPGTFQKLIGTLLKEMFNLNSGHEIMYLKDCHRIQQDYEAVKKAYDNPSQVLTEADSLENGSKQNSLPISKYDKKSIKEWSKNYKDHRPSVHESIAVAMKAVAILKGYVPRDIQILSLLCFLNPEDNKGRLAQINTGEGKTTIIAMLAAIKALQGHKIDIITSSGELAKPQSIEMEPFYSMFDLTVAHNGDDPKDIKERYRANILYGAADAFQGDILRDEYSKQGTRNGRKCDLAIVDEVDSMLIDGKNHIVMLSSLMPAMNFLETILAAIYIHIGTVANLIVERDGKAYLIERKNRINDDGSIMNNVEDELIELTVSKKEFIERSTELHIRRALRDTEGLTDFTEDERIIPEDYVELSIPKHLYELVTRAQLTKWIGSAIYAMFNCELNKHYVLTEDGKVAPVDATNTGVIQQNMHWNNGLHQFLQIKHGAKITPEHLTTNFISNVSFFKRYKENLFGLTGTLGSDDSISLLNNTYSVDSLIIPPFKRKQHHELTPIIVTNEQDWYANIIESTLQKLHQERGVLIIAPYINQVNYIFESLKTRYDRKKIKVYKTQHESDSVHAELKVGEVIIATNIAGRGTDIKPSSKLDENGGLHVCLTCLPNNNRVEAQNVGRTSRTGNKGTSQFILLEMSNQSLNQLRRIRNEKETESLKNAETEIARVCSKDTIFNAFFNFLNRIKKDNIRAVEERFGIWLQMNADKFGTESESTLLTLFKETFEVEVTSNQLIQNFCFHILKANILMNSKKDVEAIVEYSKAIETDPDFADIAYYYRGFCRIAQYGGDKVWEDQNKEIIELAQDDFEKSREIIKKRVLDLNIIQRASDGPNLSEQVKHKIIIYQTQLATIQEAIGLDKKEAEAELNNLKQNEERTKRLMSIEETENLKKDLTEIQNRIEQITKDIAEDEGGVIGKALLNNCDIRIGIKKLEKTLPPDQDLQYYKQEIDEFKANGMIGHFNISKLIPIPWIDTCIMATIAFVQIGAGAYISVISLGIGSLIGKALILEGINDLITAVKNGMIYRKIDWRMWGMLKGISLTVSLCLCSLSAINEAGKSVQVVGQGLKTVTREATKEGMSIALKNVGFELGKGVTREVVTTLVEDGFDHLVLKQIEASLLTKLQPEIYKDLETNLEVQILLNMDLKNRNSHFQNQIRQAAQDILHPRDQKKYLNIQDIANMFATRIANAKIKRVAMAVQVLSAAKASDELIKFEKSFMEKLNKSILEILTNHCESQKSNENLRTESDDRQNETIQRNLESPQLDKDNLNLDTERDEPVYAPVQGGHINLQQICKDLSEDVAKEMTNIIRSKIVIPVTRAAANFAIDKVTSEIQQTLDHALETYKSNQIIDADQDRLPDEIKDRTLDPEFMKDAKGKTEATIKKFEDGGEVGLSIEADYVSAAINQKIIIYDKYEKLYKVINDHLPGPPVEVQHHSGTDGNLGYWTLPGGLEPTVTSGENNCFLDCVAHQAGKDPQSIRDAAVQQMRQNIDRLAILMPEIERVRMYELDYLKYGQF